MLKNWLTTKDNCNNFVITKEIEMQVQIISIGNSKGIRLSKVLLEKYNLKEMVELVLEKDCIVLKPINNPRKGWEKSFKKMHENGDDQLMIDDVFGDEEFEEWK